MVIMPASRATQGSISKLEPRVTQDIHDGCGITLETMNNKGIVLVIRTQDPFALIRGAGQLRTVMIQVLIWKLTI